MRRVSLFLCVAVAMACDQTPRGRDASAPLSQRVSAVSVRIDAPGGGAPAVSVLAFRAAVSGVLATDVLGVVDPLVAPLPEGRECEVREVAAAARSLRAQGGTVELEELADVSLSLGDGAQALRPLPRVYPQLAAAVGGVIGEAGPVDMAALPEAIIIVLPASEGGAPARLKLPGVPSIVDGASGEPLTSATRFEPSADLSLTVNGPAQFLEIRPFGATLALACRVDAGGRVSVRRDLIERVMPGSGHIPVSFEAVWRTGTASVGAAGQTVQLSLEARSSAVLDLRAAVTSGADLPAPPRAAAPTGP